MKKLILLLLFIPLVSFSQQNIKTKFLLPKHHHSEDLYERNYNDEYSIFLREFPLKNNNVVKYHNGENKYNNNIWAAVFDYDIGTGNLHQCADAVIFMRAQYLYTKGLVDRLQYTFVSGFKAKYLDYLSHYYKVNGNKVSLVLRNKKLKEKPETFKKWLKEVWMYSNTWSIENFDSYRVSIMDIRPGDFFIRSNPPPGVGHAVKVVDVVSDSNGFKKVMLSQSYMPAQENHILINPRDDQVWYEIGSSTKVIQTPEFTFHSNELRRFIN